MDNILIFYDFIPLHHVYEEIKPNIDRHYTEMTEGDDYGTPDIDWELYLALSKLNRCLVVTARHGKTLVGYSVYSIGPMSRYKTIFQAKSDGIFLEKPYRAKHSREFIRKCEQYLMLTGVRETNYILSDDRVGRLLGVHGYKPKYKTWSKAYG